MPRQVSSRGNGVVEHGSGVLGQLMSAGTGKSSAKAAWAPKLIEAWSGRLGTPGSLTG